MNERSLTDSAAAKSRGKYLGFWTKDAALYEQVQSDAQRAGLSVSDYLRELTSGAPVPRKYRAANENRVQVGKFMGELGKIGSNLNQLAKQANRAGASGHWETMPTAADVAATCETLHHLLQEIRADLHTIIDKGKGKPSS